MKLRPVNKIDKKKQNNVTMTSCQKIVRHCHFSNLWPVWSNAEAGFRTHSL